MEQSLPQEFEKIMMFTSKPLEILLVKWISQYSDKIITTKSFDILHEHLDVIYEACDKVGMGLFLPEGFLESDQSLGNLVDAIKEFWKSIKNQNIFEISWEFFKTLVGNDFVFEDHLETYILDYKEIEFSLMVFLLLTFFLVRQRGNQNTMEETKIFQESPQGEEFAVQILNFFNTIDQSWENVQVGEIEGKRNTVVGGDLDLLRRIQNMKEEIGNLTEVNLELKKKVEGVDQRVKEKDDEIESLKREKNDVEQSKADLLKRIEGMKQEWLAEALEEKQKVYL